MTWPQVRESPSVPVTMLPFVLSAWLPAAILRWFSWRLALKTAEPQTQTPPPRNQFHLADVWRWITLLCLLLAVMVDFRSELEGWDGLGYAVLMYFGLMASAPTGLTVSLLLWLVLGEQWTVARGILAGLLAAAWAAVSLTAAYFASDSKMNDGDMWPGIWFLAVVVCAVTLATATALRLTGWSPTKHGLPVIAVLDANGKQLTTKNTEELEEGDHHDPEKVKAFLKELASK